MCAAVRLLVVRPLVDRHQAGEPHQALDPFAVDDMALDRQPRRHPPRAVIRPRQGLPINQRHDRAVFLADLRRSAVDRSAGDRQQSALSRYRQRWSLALDQSAPFRSAHLPSFRDKKSFRPSAGQSAGTEHQPARHWPYPPLRRRRLRKRSSLRPAAASSRRRSGSGEPRTRSPTRRRSARPLPPQGQALDRRQRHLGLERRRVLFACLLDVLLLRHRRCLGAGLHLNQFSRFPGSSSQGIHGSPSVVPKASGLGKSGRGNVPMASPGATANVNHFFGATILAVCQAHPTTPQAWRLHIDCRAADRHQPLHRRGRRQAQAVRLDQIRRGHPRCRPARETSVRSDPLVLAVSH